MRYVTPGNECAHIVDSECLCGCMSALYLGISGICTTRLYIMLFVSGCPWNRKCNGYLILCISLYPLSPLFLSLSLSLSFSLSIYLPLSLHPGRKIGGSIVWSAPLHVGMHSFIAALTATICQHLYTCIVCAYDRRRLLTMAHSVLRPRLRWSETSIEFS